MTNYQLLIEDQWVEAENGRRFDSVDPYAGKTWATVARASAHDGDRAVQAAHRALNSPAWADMLSTQRAALLRRLGDLIAENADRLAQIEVRDNGKLYAEMRAQLNYVPQYCYYYAGLADKIAGEVPPLDRRGHFGFTRREPIGVVLAITPWNSPILLAMGKIAPALAAGCTLVIKPSEFTSASTCELAKLVQLAGFPPGVINVITGFGNEIGDALVSHPLVARIAFTGGGQSARHINEIAARHFKHVSFELGGKSPNIVFDDAVIDDAVKGAVSGIFAASGQTCIAGSRLLLQRSIHDEFVDKLVKFAATARIGNPMDLDTQVGPVTTQPQYERILRYIAIAKEEGANCVLGGGPADQGGWFIQPTIFTGVSNDMTIAREEVFGPVLSVIPFNDDADALRIANDSDFGLAAGIWTQNIQRVFTMSQKLEAGTVWVNTYRAASVMMPFGGYKQSGMGRENGMDAVDSYLQTKSVMINFAAGVANPFVMRL